MFLSDIVKQAERGYHFIIKIGCVKPEMHAHPVKLTNKKKTHHDTLQKALAKNQIIGNRRRIEST